jgi:hypothetical protein
MQQDDGFRERLAWLSQLPRGSGHQVALALLVVGRPMAADELAMASGLKSRTLSEVLRWLEALGVVEKAKGGWTLSAASLATVGETAGKASVVDSSGSGNAGRSANRKNGARATHSTPPPPKRDLTMQVKHQGKGSGEEEEEESARRAAIEPLLVSAGVGRRSVKLAELLALNLDADYVAGWARYRQKQLDAGRPFPVGHLIQALQDGDAVPACDCGRCDACAQRLYARYGALIAR